MIEYILVRECLCLLFFLLLIPKSICFLRSPLDEKFEYKEEVNVKVTEGRTRRSIDNILHPQFYDLDLSVEESLVHIHLSRNSDVQTHVPILSLQHDELIERTLEERQESIYYQDDQVGGSFVVQFNEKGATNMLGIFKTKQGEYIMQMSNTSITSAFKGLHKFEVKRLQRRVNLNDFLDIGNSLNNVTFAKYNNTRTRHKRATGAYQIELLIVCDFSIYRYWYDKSLKTTEHEKETDTLITIRQFYAFLINGMDSRYKNLQTTSYTISIVFAGIIVVQSQENSTWTEAIKNTSTTPNQVFAEAALYNFSAWTQKTPGLPANDHAMLFTKYDLTLPERSSSSVKALTFVGGMCIPLYSQSVVEDGFDFLTITVASHILGHSLNALHDGDGNSCNSSDAYIMAVTISPQVASDKASHPWIFSSCSTSYFTSYIDSLDATGQNCMKNVSISFNSTALSPYDKLLPGQIYDADAQCRHIYGNNSYMCREQYSKNYSSICTVLWCYDFASHSGCKSHIAGDGSLCGSKKWCVSGVCSTDVDAPTGNDNCLYGDKKGVLIDILEWTCADIIVNSPVQCTVNSAVAEQCCSSCIPAAITQSTTHIDGTDNAIASN